MDKGLHERAVAELQKANELSPGVPIIIGYLGAAHAAAGHVGAAQKILEQLNELSKQKHVTSYAFSRIYAGLGEKDEALRWLEIAYRERSGWMALLKTEAGFDNLRSEPRFREVIGKMNFPES